MRIFFSESKPDYATYTFNYGIYCIKESHDELPAIYDRGFLPYSGDIQLKSEIFYLARSLRVDLDRFTDSSENRRMHRKISGLNIQMSVRSKAKVLGEEAFLPFAQAYAQARIGAAMPFERLQYILSMSCGTHLFTFLKDREPVGYVLACLNQNILHYWFSFFDLDLMRSHSIGKWMMWKIISWAKENALDYVYLGTCYGDKSLYKVRDHHGLSFFDGAKWNQDMKLLKSWCKQDQERSLADRLKESPDKNVYLQQI